MITTIVAYGLYYTARHISALKDGESNIPISDYRYFGDKAFGRTWQHNMRQVGLETTDDELQCLFLGVDSKDTYGDDGQHIR